MTKGTSTRRKNRLPGYLYGNFDPGDQDKLMITYKRDATHDYSLSAACGVVYEGDIHFFGGGVFPNNNFNTQHFVIETQRSGKMVKMTKKKDLAVGFRSPSCSTFAITEHRFPWSSKNIVIICFTLQFNPFINKPKSCYSFDGNINYIGDTKFDHWGAPMTKYKRNLITIGCYSVKTELLQSNKNGSFIWSEVESDFRIERFKDLFGHSLVTIPASDIKEEYALLIGGTNLRMDQISNSIFKFNGTWFQFGTWNKPRRYFSSIYWNGAVYFIGGEYGDSEDDQKTKMEIWQVTNYQREVETSENWPELDYWKFPKLFIVEDSFFPDY